ncbi:hypothetical protein D3C87_1211410 [compost metagenome]
MSWMFGAPSGTAASMARRCASVNVASVIMAGSRRMQPGTMPLSGTRGAEARSSPWSKAAPAFSRCTSRVKSDRVGCSKIARAGMGQPWRRKRSINWIAISEWPPSSKKLSERPTRGVPSTACQSAATAVSASPRGGS